MEKDKLIKQTLKSTQWPPVSGDFQYKTMQKVFLLAEKKRKRAYMLNLAGISFVSLLLVAACVYILKVYFAFSFTLPEIHLTSSSLSILMFSFYIAALVFLLIGLDAFMRRRWLMRNADGHDLKGL
jgi:ABC-type protease/lipase transport system fused ATPase/permease subunit